ncbi:MAG TPA: PepSY domain-containing protein [Hyphomicrobiales bacterium]|nr:PepSY domain-containing protein [Hyphomicrobiales bacterium]
MKFSFTSIPAAIALLACLCVMPAVHAASQDPPRVQRGLMGNDQGQRGEEQARVSRSEASDRARQVFPGRVLNIRLEGDQWRIRMDQEGTVFNVFVDAESGQVKRGAAE